MLVSIIVPCFNEEKNLNTLVEEFEKIVNNGYPIELILVDNGSTDNSQQLLCDILKRYYFIKTTKVDKNQGYGYGILSGLALASGQYLGWIHADLQFEAVEVSNAIEILKKYQFPDSIFIKGLRRNRPIVDKIFTIGMSLFESILLGKKMWDINAQPTIFNRKLYDEWQTPPYDFSLDLYAFYTAITNGYKVHRFPVIQHKRKEGISSWNNGIKARMRLIKRVITYSIELKRQIPKD